MASGTISDYQGATLTLNDASWGVTSSNVCAYTTGTTGYTLIYSAEEKKVPENKKLLLLLP